jgi:putative ABC transport system permease protein
MRQAWAEVGLLTTVGAALGVVLAYGIVGGVVRMADRIVPRLDDVRIDAPVLIFSMFVTLVVTLLTAIAPSAATLRSRTVGEPADGLYRPLPLKRVRRSLCVIELALSVILLVGATLLGRSLFMLMRQDLGVSTDHVVTASLQVRFQSLGGRLSDAETLERVERVIDRIRTMPGIRAVGVGAAIPPSTSRIRMSLGKSRNDVDYTASLVPVSPGYFSALQTRLIRGRFFTAGDDRTQPAVMIMTERTAKRLFPDADPIGRTLRLPVVQEGKNSMAELRLVGVVADVKYAGLGELPEDVVFRPFAQQPWIAPFLVARTTNDPEPLVATIRRTIASVDPGMVISLENTLDGLLSTDAAPARFQTLVLAILTLLAVTLAAIGLYGVIAFSVAQRTKEFGIRIAVGAAPARLMGMVLTEGLVNAAFGLAIGVSGALGAVRLLKSVLFGVAPTDFVSFSFSVLVLLAVAILATYLPARRATEVDPLTALRCE